MPTSSHAGKDLTPTEAVLDCVAEAAGTSTLDLPPLYETIDTDALNKLLTDAGDGVRVEFDYHGCTVTATASEVTVQQPVATDSTGTELTC